MPDVDHFLALVELVAAEGDDPTAVRLRRATAGESPARFRDRLVLERAAHLVRETERPLQDIAADCGFRGYDVFARAFRRELGALPSEWRASPTSLVIDAPGDVHFHPPDGLRLPARRRMDSVDLVVAMVEQHVDAVTSLVDAAAGLAESDLGAAVRGAGLLPAVAELVDRMERLTALVRDTAHERPDPEPLARLRDRLDLVGPELVAAVALLGATGRFDEAFVDASPEPEVLTFGAMVARLVTDADDLLRLTRARLAACGADLR